MLSISIKARLRVGIFIYQTLVYQLVEYLLSKRFLCSSDS